MYVLLFFKGLFDLVDLLWKHTFENVSFSIPKFIKNLVLPFFTMALTLVEPWSCGHPVGR